MNRGSGIDRLAARKHPGSPPVLRQAWRNLLFLHWQLPPAALRGRLPAGLALDTFEGAAWIGITPFEVRHLRPAFCPPLPCIGHFHEINVRTYVQIDGVPGVWFFSLDADSLAAVIGASTCYRLPYHLASMSCNEQENRIRYRSRRSVAGPAPSFEATWCQGETLGEAAPESLEFFLVERYCLYAAQGETIYRARIHHRPWRLRQVQLLGMESSMLAAQGLPKVEGAPLLHGAASQEVSVWPLLKVK